MKPVFKCDYCKFMGTEEEVKEHEPKCTDNYDRKSCYTCVHAKLTSKDGKYSYKCEAGKEIPEEKIFEFCDKHERKIRVTFDGHNLFGNVFGFGL